MKSRDLAQILSEHDIAISKKYKNNKIPPDHPDIAALRNIYERAKSEDQLSNDTQRRIFILLKISTSKEKAISDLRTTFDDWTLRNSNDLTKILKNLKKDNLLHQENINLFFNMTDEKARELSDISGIIKILTEKHVLSPHIITFLLSNEQESINNAKMRGILRHIRHNTLTKADVDFILNNHLKLPTSIIDRFHHIPDHLFDMKLLKALIAITERSGLSPEEVVTQMHNHIHRIIFTYNADRERGHGQQEINYNQSVHNDEVEQSVRESTRKLKASYPQALEKESLETSYKEILKFADTLGRTPDQKAAETAIKRLLNNPYDDSFRVEGITIKEAMGLVWRALHDTTKYHEQVTLETAKKNFIHLMYQIERAYNLDDNGKDDGRASRNTCTGGTFNKVIASLNTIHKEVSINFNSRELASIRLKAIIKEEAKKASVDEPLLNETISNIPSLKSVIETRFKENTENAQYHDVLTILNDITIKTAITEPEKPNPAPVNVEAVNDEPPRQNGRILNWLKNNLPKANILNPFREVTYNDETEKNESTHPLPHTRTLHTSFLRKVLDTFTTFYGSNNYINITDLSYEKPQLGLIDYATFGILQLSGILLRKLRETALLRKILDSGRYAGRSFALGFIALAPLIILTAVSIGIKFLLAITLTTASLPFIALSHGISKIILAIQTKRAMQKLALDEPREPEAKASTCTIQKKFKEYCIPSVDNKSVSAFVKPHRPIDFKRVVQFSANGSKGYVRSQFLLNKKEDIEKARAIATVNRQACHELFRTHMLSSCRVK